MTYNHSRSGFWGNLVKFIIFIVASRYFFIYVLPIVLLLWYVLAPMGWAVLHNPANNPVLCKITR